MNSPVFIIGNPRSGTTLFRLMVTSHSAIVIPPECGFAIWWHEKYRDWQSADAISPRAGEFVSDLLQSKKIETWELNRGKLLEEIQQAAPESYAALVSLVYTAYARPRKPGFRRWGDKNNFHVRHVSALRSMFPDARFIHIIRDGRDVACSYQQLGRAKIDSAYAPKLSSDVAAIATEWKGNVEAVRWAFSLMPQEQRLEIRYEDLVAKSETTLREVCRFLGEEYDPAMLEYHRLNRRDTLEPVEFLQWKAKTLEAPDPSSLGRFRTELTSGEIESFDKIAGDLLRDYRYN